jgi:DNA-directed RNA polymerase specialized sigma24 family protein
LIDVDAPITEWIKQLKQGDEQAARDLWSRYFDRICRYAHTRLGDTPRRASDDEDVALSAFHALCAGAREGRFRQLENRDDLWQLLVVIASRKATDQWRKASRRPEVGESALHAAVELVADARPESLESLAATCAELLPQLDAKLFEVAMMKLEGYTNAEIAQKRNRSEKTIERYLRMIRAKWTETCL